MAAAIPEAQEAASDSRAAGSVSREAGEGRAEVIRVEEVGAAAAATRVQAQRSTMLFFSPPTN